jgi:hypothetical protein
MSFGQAFKLPNEYCNVLLRHDTRSYLKKVDQGSGQGAGQRKSAAYTVVCEHFEPIRNAAMERQAHF